MAKPPYKDSDIQGTSENISVQFSSYNIELPNGLAFKDGKTSITDNINSTVKIGEKIKKEVTVNINKKYVPENINKQIYLDVSAKSGTTTETGYCEISVCNLDLQNTKTEASVNGKEEKKEVDDAQDKLSELGDTVLSIDRSALQEFFSQTEINNIENSVKVWLSSVLATAALAQDKSFIEKLQSQFGLTYSAIMKNIFNKALKELGVSLNLTTSTVNIKQVDTAYTDILALASKGTEKGKALNVHFSLDMDFYSVDSGSSFGGFGTISYYVTDSNGNVHKPIVSTMKPEFGGMVTYASIEALVESMKKVALSSVQNVYSEIWGNDADKVVSAIMEEVNNEATNRFIKALTSSTMEKVLKKGKITFSNGLFKTSQKMSENACKKISNHCPVDIYIYDSSYKLCASIVENEINNIDDSISMYVEDDEKYFYLMNDNYNVKYIGNGTGSMDIEITSYVDGEEVREVAYKGIPLEKNTAYYSNIPELVYADNIIMNPLAAAGSIINPSSDNWQDNQPGKVNVAGVKLDKNTLSLAKGSKETLHTIIEPSNATNKNVIWSSSNISVVTVTGSGIVTAVNEGTAVIQAKTEDGGYEAVCTVTVTKQSQGNSTSNPSGGGSSSGVGAGGSGSSGGGSGSSTGGGGSSSAGGAGGSSGGGTTTITTSTPAPSNTITATQTPVQVITSTPSPKPFSSTTPGTGSDSIFDNNSKKEITYDDVTLNKKSVIYSGKAKKPSVTVLSGSLELTKNKDYTVSYLNNKNVGTATVVVNGIGNYTGSITKSFKIIPKGTPLKGKIKPKHKGFTAKWKKQPKSITGYQVQYSTGKKFKGKTTVIKTVKKKSVTKLKASKLKAKKKYYVRVRTYKTVKGKKYYSRWSKSKTVKTKK